MAQFQTPYDVFFDAMKIALAAAEAKHGFPGKAAGAYLRLKTPELTGGPTGFLTGVELAAAVNGFVAYMYEGQPAPYWVTEFAI
jgi:hypothetical protein